MEYLIIASIIIGALFVWCYTIAFFVRMSWADCYPIRNWKDLILLKRSTYRDHISERRSSLD